MNKSPLGPKSLIVIILIVALLFVYLGLTQLANRTRAEQTTVEKVDEKLEAVEP